MGEVSNNFILEVTLPAHTTTEDSIGIAIGPLIEKSLPSGATELHSTGRLSFNIISLGLQLTGKMLSMIAPAIGETVKESETPTSICVLHISNSVLPSVPALDDTM